MVAVTTTEEQDNFMRTSPLLRRIRASRSTRVAYIAAVASVALVTPLVAAPITAPQVATAAEVPEETEVHDRDFSTIVISYPVITGTPGTVAESFPDVYDATTGLPVSTWELMTFRLVDDVPGLSVNIDTGNVVYEAEEGSAVGPNEPVDVEVTFVDGSTRIVRVETAVGTMADHAGYTLVPVTVDNVLTETAPVELEYGRSNDYEAGQLIASILPRAGVDTPTWARIRDEKVELVVTPDVYGRTLELPVTISYRDGSTTDDVAVWHVGTGADITPVIPDTPVPAGARSVIPVRYEKNGWTIPGGGRTDLAVTDGPDWVTVADGSVLAVPGAGVAPGEYRVQVSVGLPSGAVPVDFTIHVTPSAGGGIGDHHLAPVGDGRVLPGREVSVRLPEILHGTEPVDATGYVFTVGSDDVDAEIVADDSGEQVIRFTSPPVGGQRIRIDVTATPVVGDHDPVSAPVWLVTRPYNGRHANHYDNILDVKPGDGTVSSPVVVTDDDREYGTGPGDISFTLGEDAPEGASIAGDGTVSVPRSAVVEAEILKVPVTVTYVDGSTDRNVAVFTTLDSGAFVDAVLAAGPQGSYSMRDVYLTPGSDRDLTLRDLLFTDADFGGTVERFPQFTGVGGSTCTITAPDSLPAGVHLEEGFGYANCDRAVHVDADAPTGTSFTVDVAVEIVDAEGARQQLTTTQTVHIVDNPIDYELPADNYETVPSGTASAWDLGGGIPAGDVTLVDDASGRFTLTGDGMVFTPESTDAGKTFAATARIRRADGTGGDVAWVVRVSDSSVLTPTVDYGPLRVARGETRTFSPYVTPHPRGSAGPVAATYRLSAGAPDWLSVDPGTGVVTAEVPDDAPARGVRTLVEVSFPDGGTTSAPLNVEVVSLAGDHIHYNAADLLAVGPITVEPETAFLRVDPVSFELVNPEQGVSIDDSGVITIDDGIMGADDSRDIEVTAVFGDGSRHTQNVHVTTTSMARSYVTVYDWITDITGSSPVTGGWPTHVVRSSAPHGAPAPEPTYELADPEATPDASVDPRTGRVTTTLAADIGEADVPVRVTYRDGSSRVAVVHFTRDAHLDKLTFAYPERRVHIGLEDEHVTNENAVLPSFVNSAAGTQRPTVHGTWFEATPGQGNADLFTVDRNSGEVTLLDPVARAGETLTLNVTAHLPGGSTATADATFTVDRASSDVSVIYRDLHGVERGKTSTASPIFVPEAARDLVSTFILLDGPDGMEIDPTTGVVTYTPTGAPEDGRVDIIVEFTDGDAARGELAYHTQSYADAIVPDGLTADLTAEAGHRTVVSVDAFAGENSHYRWGPKRWLIRSVEPTGDAWNGFAPHITRRENHPDILSFIAPDEFVGRQVDLPVTLTYPDGTSVVATLRTTITDPGHGHGDHGHDHGHGGSVASAVRFFYEPVSVAADARTATSGALRFAPRYRPRHAGDDAPEAGELIDLWRAGRILDVTALTDRDVTVEPDTGVLTVQLTDGDRDGQVVIPVRVTFNDVHAGSVTVPVVFTVGTGRVPTATGSRVTYPAASVAAGRDAFTGPLILGGGDRITAPVDGLRFDLASGAPAGAVIDHATGVVGLSATRAQLAVDDGVVEVPVTVTFPGGGVQTVVAGFVVREPGTRTHAETLTPQVETGLPSVAPALFTSRITVASSWPEGVRFTVVEGSAPGAAVTDTGEVTTTGDGSAPVSVLVTYPDGSQDIVDVPFTGYRAPTPVPYGEPVVHPDGTVTVSPEPGTDLAGVEFSLDGEIPGGVDVAPDGTVTVRPAPGTGGGRISVTVITTRPGEDPARTVISVDVPRKADTSGGGSSGGRGFVALLLALPVFLGLIGSALLHSGLIPGIPELLSPWFPRP
ncbi:Rib/alpha-like domain-containing protein [Corynebacterium sp. P7202]|uniref:Rib/alpha-like domain-containing protein n=1 Tax=Corynebacterium pygosceleis TaxID=2800406 RepID=A0A9Q4C956_9CORY|nr:Rib/alpha-like domain-containing protein [Corynebacterium pygosceleis]MCK7637752.1 Rib/alpha-like domain-containing protein [Corynebacterium pygosceleis]MCX7467918.1 Rib/alpha-like domain-containing protein [Corynebacterium pygosceleis]